MASTNKKTPPQIMPSWAFLRSHPAHMLSFGFGSGLAQKAPGTWGTLVALPIFAALQIVLPNPIIFVFCVPLFALGVYAAELTGRALGVSDYGGIVIDEIVAMMMVLCFTPNTPLAWLLAFALFRLFDIIKPWPISWFDRRVKGGLGVMLDDLIAALFAIAGIIGLSCFI
ncbi:phosphatidylglycerophosphatase A [Chitinibacter bivalviorum]|uniref:Phosphatidylglycerophosphatase A n=1 Tax=Chitinibacter bivalviorum TaxID=2739434 RepID=A0A7H9BHC4_9NEIS|nr:phosphatidylglycerophosphatase A [Chitinibacter bivalviorum]QLG87608.1 phosphatidylglycerophosphatase A [Chitinibacter bivalviorum]